LQKELGDDLVRWVPSHNIHLTLKFLGEVPGSHLDFINQLLINTADANTEFDMQVTGLGSFPPSKRPRLIWIGLQAPGALASIQQAIESGTTRLGYEKETRSFSPHLTLGRVKQTLSPGETDKIQRALKSVQVGNIATARVDSVHLYKSDLRPTGSIYTKLFTAKLQAA
jgi:2'-5' RNA ligase